MIHKLTIICDADFSQNYSLDKDEEIHHSYLLFSDKKDCSCKSIIHLNKDHSSAYINIVWIIHNENRVTIDGQILIGQWGTHTSWHLAEEVLIIWNHSYTHTKPILDVANNNVSASHWAKIHRIPKDQLFYLMCRGLTQEEAKKIIIWWYIEKLFEKDTEVEVIHNDQVKKIEKSWKKEIIKWIYDVIFGN